MDPSLLNFAGPSNYRLHQQKPLSHPAQHPNPLAQYPEWSLPSTHLPTSQIPSSAQPSFSSSSSPSGPTAPSPSTDQPDGAQDPRTDSNNVLSGPLVEPHQDLNEFLESFWTRQMEAVEREEQDGGKVNVSLPLARIKKVMKSDEEVKMISAEVPIMFSKACEELTCRAWLVAESHKRRTLQRSDVAAAIAHSDMFDFLIDVVPRDGEGDGAVEGEESKAQSIADDDAQEGDEGEEMYKEFVEGDE